MDKIIAGAAERGIKIILDNHRSTSGGVLLNDWVSIHKEKQALLKGIQYPLLISPKLRMICPSPWH
jgi:hypothetical protein